MTKVKCNHIKNRFEAVYKNQAKPIYCQHRGTDGYCVLEEIELNESDSGWYASCHWMAVKNE